MRQSSSESSGFGNSKEPTNAVDKNKQANQRANAEFRFVILTDGKSTGPKGPRAIVTRRRRLVRRTHEQANATALLATQQSEPLTLYSVSPRFKTWPILTVSIVLLLIGGGFFSVANALAPLRNIFSGLVSATITITPDNHQLQKFYDLKAVTVPLVANQQQVPARVLSFTTAAQSITVPASGTSIIPATYASGTLTFQNILSAEQTIPAGTVFIDKNGIRVANGQSVTVPATQLLSSGGIVAGTITVPAQALVPGIQGNIPQFDFNNAPSSVSGVTVENTAPFSGGQVQQTYHYVEQSDIDHAVNALQKSLEQKGRTALLGRMSPDERLVGQIQYTRSVSSPYKGGETVEGNITVTVSVTCFGEVYNQRLAQMIIESQLQTEGSHTFSVQYKLAGPITVQVISTKQLDPQGTLSLHIQAKGLWAYQIPNSELQVMLKRVVGKSENAAQAILEHETGVQKAQINLSLIAGNTLPQNSHQITLHEALTP